MRVAAYLRVSTEDQRERQTVETQRHHAEKWIDLYKHELAGWYADEGVSGTIPVDQRPEGARLLKDAAAKQFDAVIVYKLDRWGRSPLVIHNGINTLENLGVGFVSTSETFDTTSPGGKVMYSVLAAFAGFERDTIRERCAGGMARVAKDGRYLGGVVSYGYRSVDRFLQPDTDLLPGLDFSESEVVAMIFQWAHERITCWQIADRLTAMGVPTPVDSGGEGKNRKNWKQTTGRWNAETVRNILRSEVYTGVRKWGKTCKGRNGKRENTDIGVQIVQSVPALITREVFESVGRILTTNRTFADRNSKYPYLLKGLIRCSLCGHTFIGTTKSKGGEATRRYYICLGRHSRKRVFGPDAAACPAPLVRVEDIESDLWETLLSHLRDAEGTLLKLQDRQGTQQQRTDTLSGQQADVRRALKRNEEARRRIIDLLTDGIVTKTEGADKLQRLRDEGNTLTAQQERLALQAETLTAQDSRLREADDFIHAWRDRLAEAEEGFTPQQKRRCVEAFVSGITVRDEGGQAVATYHLCFSSTEAGVVNRT